MEPLPIAIGLPGEEPSPLPASNPAAAARLNGRQKAALIVQLLAREGASLSLQQLSEDTQGALIEQIGQLGMIDQETIDAVVAEFAERLETVGMTGPHGIRKALDMLDGAVSPRLAKRLRSRSNASSLGDPWERIGSMEAADLAAMIEGQSNEVAAIILSKLNVAKSAEILGLLPGDRARRLTYSISQISGARPASVHRIGIAVVKMLSVEPNTAFDEGPVEMVGAILNSSRASTRNTVLEGLDEDDKDFAEEVRKAIFTFGNIPDRLAPRDVPKVIRGVDQSVLVIALAAASATGLEKSSEFILANISQRMADNIREEMKEAGEISEEAGEDAMGELIGSIRSLEEAGEIHLIVGE